MRTRVEKRLPRRTAKSDPMRMPRLVVNHLRGILDLGRNKRVTLATVALPLRGDVGVAGFVQRCVVKLVKHAPDDATLEMLITMLAGQADKYRETDEHAAARMKFERRTQRVTNIAMMRDDRENEGGD